MIKLARSGIRWMLLASALLVTTWVAPAGALESLVLYDNFDAANISTTKWLGGEGSFLLGREATRVIESGRLRMRSRSVGFTAGDVGSGRTEVFLAAPDPAAVTGMKATVSVSSLNVLGCSGNATATQSFAGLIGSFFNVGTPVNGDQTGDVVGVVAISRSSASTDPAGTLRVGGLIAQCGDGTCQSFTVLGGADLGTIPTGASATLVIRWDQPNHRFFFRRDVGPFVVPTYQVSDTASPGLPFKDVQVQNDVANCTTTPQPIANISALFNDVFLNSSAVGP